MRSVTGAPVEGDDFFDRAQEQRQMWRRLESDSLLLLAPRRIGKTSLMRALCADAADHGFRAMGLSFAPCEDEMGCIQELAKAVAAAESGIGADLARLQKGLAARLPNLKSIKIGPVGIDLAATDNPGWRAVGEALAAGIGDLDGRWLICVDEVPVFLLKLLGQDDGRERVRGFLYWLRNLRQDHHGGIRWVLAGSIGLDTVAARLGLGDTVNDLVPTPLGAFDPATADRFLQSLAESYAIRLTKPLRARLIEQLGWPVPYYLQIAFSKLYDLCDAGAKPSAMLVDQVFVELLGPSHKGYFDYWRQRLGEELGTPDDGYAVHLLNHCCRDPQGAGRATLKLAMGERVQDPDACEERLRYLLDILESDGYLFQVEGRYRFRLDLLRRYWQARVAL